jgi:hypothetical protein
MNFFNLNAYLESETAAPDVDDFGLTLTVFYSLAGAEAPASWRIDIHTMGHAASEMNFFSSWQTRVVQRGGPLSDRPVSILVGGLREPTGQGARAVCDQALDLSLIRVNWLLLAFSMWPWLYFMR